MDQLIGPEDVRRGDTGAIGADIEGLGELDELGAGGVGAADEDGYLQTETWRPSCRRGAHALPCLENVCLHGFTWYQGTSTVTSILHAR